MTKIGQSTKTQTYRSQNFIDSYFKGKVIDIGGGGDPLNKKVEVFDLKMETGMLNLSSNIGRQNHTIVSIVLTV